MTKHILQEMYEYRRTVAGSVFGRGKHLANAIKLREKPIIVVT